MLYVVFWILVLLHGPHFWKWFIVPGVLFIMEKISRSKFIKMARFGETFIEEVNLLPSGVSFTYFELAILTRSIFCVKYFHLKLIHMPDILFL
jgi:hypothetical protein